MVSPSKRVSTSRELSSKWSLKACSKFHQVPPPSLTSRFSTTLTGPGKKDANSPSIPEKSWPTAQSNQSVYPLTKKWKASSLWICQCHSLSTHRSSSVILTQSTPFTWPSKAQKARTLARESSFRSKSPHQNYSLTPSTKTFLEIKETLGSSECQSTQLQLSYACAVIAQQRNWVSAKDTLDSTTTLTYYLR